MSYSLGIDVGSTTAKVVLTRSGKIIFERYERHFSRVKEKCAELLSLIRNVTLDENVSVAFSGSAGLGISEAIGVPFVQEVFATAEVIKKLEPDTSCVIELGGEDAKIIFFDGGIDERMNGTCAGGTGAFIDQMATLLNLTVDEMDDYSMKADKIYPIASRCGVFAKTDIQPLLNQGARKEDISASIFQAVVNQTIAGLAQGKRIRGKVVFLGGPLYFCKGLRKRFSETLALDEENSVFPEYARISVALGASMYAEKAGFYISVGELTEKIKNSAPALSKSDRLPALFASEQDYMAFKERHAKASVPAADIDSYRGKAYLGIDCGSTTTKLTLISEGDEILYSFYASNKGNPVDIVKEQLEHIYSLCADRITIASSAVTGYGEELIKHAFGVDFGIVETIAHYTAARHFKPNVDFILDIGGQDIKCFKIKYGAIDSIMLNEACSSGCGSFLETFAKAMGYSVEEFARRGLFAPSPVNLGSRCTVFMNSSVKQSQKDGASVEDISAGLSVSVVKNAIYKVIRATSAEELGKNVVVQGGTFYNDGVLRALEMELGIDVVRPQIAGLMGAYGAALYSKSKEQSTLISRDALKSFSHTSKSTLCNGCTNHCHITVNSFGKDAKKFISGNQCEKALGITKSTQSLPNIYEFKRNYLRALISSPHCPTRKETVGFPLALGMYETLPFWLGIFRELGFGVRVSNMSSRRTYERGQFTIPSDTACYPAKIMHGHVAELIEDGVRAFFYPCITYNFNEKESDNHYNCPIVAYYSELLRGNVEDVKDVKFLFPYLNINDKKELSRGLYSYLSEHFSGITRSDVKRAIKRGFDEYEKYMSAVKNEGKCAIEYAREHGHRIMILAGRPYHIDPEICHGIDKLASLLGFVVVSEDCVAHLSAPVSVNVLNQWTYHARLYRAAAYATEHSDTEFVQLVSFGCGIDAITTDEARAILESRGKYYTQLKIDEITNLGAVKIRLRSLIGALEKKQEKR